MVVGEDKEDVARLGGLRRERADRSEDCGSSIHNVGQAGSLRPVVNRPLATEQSVAGAPMPSALQDTILPHKTGLGRVLPGPAVRAPEKLVGGRISWAILTVPLNAASEAPTDHAKQGGGCGAVSDFNIAHSPALTPDGAEEIGPEFLDVLAVGIVELGLHVDDLLTLLDRVEGPAIAPAHVERTLRAVKIGADQVLLGIVAGVV